MLREEVFGQNYWANDGVLKLFFVFVCRTEAAEVEGALARGVAWLPGGRDLEGRPLLLVPLSPPAAPSSSAPPATPSSSGTATPLSVNVAQPEGRECLAAVLRYLVSVFCTETRAQGVTVLVDAREVAWRTVRAAVRVILAALQPDLGAVLVLRPDSWQRVDSCTRSKRKGEVRHRPLESHWGRL